MAHDAGLRLVLLSTYPPTQCGLATFTAALRQHLGPPLDLDPAAGRKSLNAGAAHVVRIVDHAWANAPQPEVVAELVIGSRASAATAVAVMNTYDAVIVQHEYGIYGGPDGADVIPLIEALTVPMIAVLHTVLTEPSPSQRRILLRVVAAAERVVTMTQTAKTRLVELYGVNAGKIAVIAHGAVDLSAIETSLTRETDARPLILTWGLLGPGKGIEWAIDAMAALRDLNPRYLVLGKTHPKVLQQQGESYRQKLQSRARVQGLSELVEFDDSYLTVPELAQVVASADVVLLPYDSVDQVTSGVLIEAIAAARPVVSTSFPHARELLEDGAGTVIPQQDSAAIAVALRAILTSKDVAARMIQRSQAKAGDLLWPAVGAQYRGLALTLLGDRVSIPA